MGRAVEASRRLAPVDDDRALEELEAHGAGHPALALVDRGLQHRALGREPEAVVDERGVARHQLVLQVGGRAVERQALDRAVGGDQDRAPRRLVDAARLHADEAVLHHVDPSDPVGTAESVQPLDQGGGVQRRAVHRHRVAVVEIDLHPSRAVGRALRRDGAREHRLVRSDPRILQRLALVGDVQEVGVGRVGRLAVLVTGDRDLVPFGVGDERLAGGEVPFAPWCYDADVRLVRIVAEFEPHLVVALARRPVGHRVGAGLAGDLDLPPGDERAGDRRPEEIDALVERVGAEHREDVIARERLAQILDVDLPRAERFRPGARGRQFLALADVGGEGDDLAAVALLQPAQDDRRVEPAGVGEYHLFRHLTHGLSLPPAQAAASRGRSPGVCGGHVRSGRRSAGSGP